MAENTVEFPGQPCWNCGSTWYPHECMQLPVILNSRYFCPTGDRHVWAARLWPFRPRCSLCGEKSAP